MYQLLLDLIREDQEFFNDEEKKAEFFLKRGKMPLLKSRQIDFWLWCAKACQMELEQLEEGVKILKMEYYAITIRGSIEENAEGKKWPKFWTVLKFIVKGEENKGYQDKAISLKFDKSIDWTKLGGGFLVVHKSNIYKPKIYEIKEENGKKIYPYVFIKEIYSFDPEPVFESEEMKNG